MRNPIIQEVLDKRNAELPEKMPDQHINYALKKNGKIAGIHEKVEKRAPKVGSPKGKHLKNTN